MHRVRPWRSKIQIDNSANIYSGTSWKLPRHLLTSNRPESGWRQSWLGEIQKYQSFHSQEWPNADPGHGTSRNFPVEASGRPEQPALQNQTGSLQRNRCQDDPGNRKPKFVDDPSVRKLVELCDVSRLSKEKHDAVGHDELLSV